MATDDGDADITGMLAAASGGDAAAAERLVGLVYDELRRRAEALMRREAPGYTVQATILVHDAYRKLIRQDGGRRRGPRGVPRGVPRGFLRGFLRGFHARRP